MNLTLNRSKFQSKLQACANALESRTYMDKRDGVLLELRDGFLSMGVANQDTSIGATMAVESSKESLLSSAYVPVEKLIQSLKNLKDETVNLVFDGKSLIVKGKKSRVSLVPYDQSNFIIFNIEDIKLSPLDSDLVRGVIASRFASTDKDLRTSAAAVLVRKVDGKVTVLANDDNSVLCSVFDAQAFPLDSHLFPLKIVDALDSAIEASDGGVVSFGRGNNIMMLTVGDEFIIQSRLHSFNPPSIEKVAIKYCQDDLGSAQVSLLNRVEFIDAIKLVYPFAESILQGGVLKTCYFKSSDGSIAVASGKTAFGDINTELEVEGMKPGVEFCINSKYMINFLSRVDSEKIAFGFTERNKPIVLKGEMDGLSYYQVISPIHGRSN